METVQVDFEQLQIIADALARCSAGVWFAVGCWLAGQTRDAMQRGW